MKYQNRYLKKQTKKLPCSLHIVNMKLPLKGFLKLMKIQVDRVYLQALNPPMGKLGGYMSMLVRGGAPARSGVEVSLRVEEGRSLLAAAGATRV